MLGLYEALQNKNTPLNSSPPPSLLAIVENSNLYSKQKHSRLTNNLIGSKCCISVPSGYFANLAKKRLL